MLNIKCGREITVQIPLDGTSPTLHARCRYRPRYHHPYRRRCEVSQPRHQHRTRSHRRDSRNITSCMSTRIRSRRARTNPTKLHSPVYTLISIFRDTGFFSYTIYLHVISVSVMRQSY